MSALNVTLRPDGKYAVSFPYSGSLVEKAREVPGFKWDKEGRAWVGYPDAVDAFCLKATGATWCENLIVDWYCLNQTDVRSYQTYGIDWLANNAATGCILADYMGCGKTLQAIRAAKHFNTKTLVVCPSFVRGVWVKELEKWWPGVKVQALEGLSAQEIDPNVQVALCHYDILYAHVSALDLWGVDVGILDECHFVANSKSRRSEACKSILGRCSKRIGLTGTPMTNRPKDLWNVVETLSPGRLGSFFQYARTFCDAHQVTIGGGPEAKVVYDFNGRSNLEELNRRLQYFMLRRTYADVKLELPEKTRQVIELKIPKKYQVMVPPNTSSKVLRKALDQAADAKLKEVLALCRQHVEDGHRVVAFTYRREVAEKVAAECGGLAITGAYSQKQRDERIETCRTSNDPCLLAATIDVASVGIDLSFADVVVFCELTYEPVELAQAESRCHRFGQERPVLVQFPIALGTVDTLIRDKVCSKLDSIEKAVGDDMTGLAQGMHAMSEEEALVELWKAL